MIKAVRIRWAAAPDPYTSIVVGPRGSHPSLGATFQALSMKSPGFASCLDGEEAALEDAGWDDGRTSAPRIRAPVATGHRLRAMALAAFTGMALGAGAMLIAADLPPHTDLALACPQIQPMPPGFHGSAPDM